MIDKFGLSVIGVYFYGSVFILGLLMSSIPSVQFLGLLSAGAAYICQTLAAFEYETENLKLAATLGNAALLAMIASILFGAMGVLIIGLSHVF